MKIKILGKRIKQQIDFSDSAIIDIRRETKRDSFELARIEPKLISELFKLHETLSSGIPKDISFSIEISSEGLKVEIVFFPLLGGMMGVSLPFVLDDNLAKNLTLIDWSDFRNYYNNLT